MNNGFYFGKSTINKHYFRSLLFMEMRHKCCFAVCTHFNSYMYTLFEGRTHLLDFTQTSTWIFGFWSPTSTLLPSIPVKLWTFQHS